MKKVLIKNAIHQESVYMLDNHYTADFNEMVDSVKGRIKLLNFEKFKLEQAKTEKKIDDEFINNLIGKLELEYTNLNQYENFDTILDKFYLVDLDGFRFQTIRDIDVIVAIYENENKDWMEYKIGNFIPKIKKRLTIFFLLPDEETDYFLELEDGTIEEI